MRQEIVLRLEHNPREPHNNSAKLGARQLQCWRRDGNCAAAAAAAAEHHNTAAAAASRATANATFARVNSPNWRRRGAAGAAWRPPRDQPTPRRFPKDGGTIAAAAAKAKVLHFGQNTETATGAAATFAETATPNLLPRHLREKTPKKRTLPTVCIYSSSVLVTHSGLSLLTSSCVDLQHSICVCVCVSR